MGELRYCFEQKYVPSVLSKTSKSGLAVVDTAGCEPILLQETNH